MTDYVPQDAIGFSTYLENILAKYSLSGSEFARQIHVNRSTISLYRSGDRLPDDPIIAEIAIYLVKNKKSDLDLDILVKEILYAVHISKMRKLYAVHVSQMRKAER